MEPKFPAVKVNLVGQDGNAFAIVGRASAAARRGGVPQQEIKDFQREATSGDYDHLLMTIMKWFDVD